MTRSMGRIVEHSPNPHICIDKAFSHPDETDLIELKNAASK